MKHLKRLTDPFVVGVIITGIYLGTIAYETLVVGASANWVESNNLNSLGDFLAGVFAPVAFLWLIVTVFLQKQELKLTRDEMIEQRKAMQKQANEAEAHKGFVEKQTQIMSDQANEAKVTYAKTRKLQMFEKRMDVYDAIVEFSDKDIYGIIGDEVKIEFQHLSNKMNFLFAGDEKIIFWIGEMSSIVDEVVCIETAEANYDEWKRLRDPKLFHMRFHKHLTIYE